VLGTDRVNEIHDEVVAAFQTTVDATAWRLFTVGTEPEREAFFALQQGLLMDEGQRGQARGIAQGGGTNQK